MSASQKMKNAILKNVVPELNRNGFVGEYPNYRRFFDDRVEIISFGSYKFGNAICVEASTAFFRSENNNYTTDWGFNGDFNTITTSDCYDFYKLKGNFEELFPNYLFYYSDVYCDVFGISHLFEYHSVSEEKAKTYKKKWSEFLVQKADENTYDKVCALIIKRLPKAYKWLKKMSK